MRQRVVLGDASVASAAMELAESMGIPDFKASQHWILRFKKRHGIIWASQATRTIML